MLGHAEKSVKYTQQLVLVNDEVGSSSSSVSVQFATCKGCVAGSHGGLCSHVFAVLMGLNEERERKTASCTSLPQSWGPRPRNVDPVPVMEVVVEKPRSSSNRKGQPSRCTLYDARGIAVRIVGTDRIDRLRESLEKGCPMKGFLPHTVFQASSDFGSVPFGSMLTYHRHNVPEPASPPPKPKMTPVGMPWLPLSSKRPVAPFTLQWPITLLDAQELEQRTTGQASNAEWISLHKSTVTASNFWRIGHRKANMCSLPPLLFDGPSLRHVPAVKHGNEHEDIAVKEYIAAMATRGNGIHVRQCGIALHTDYQFIGASPDGMVCDQSAKPRFGVLDVKCPFSAYAKCWSLKDAAEQDKGFCLQFQDGQLRLKKKHPYYWQVQGQMAITNTSWCDFVVWVSAFLVTTF